MLSGWKKIENVNSIEKVEVRQEMVKMQCKKMFNWKVPQDGVQRYRLKNLKSLHLSTAVQLNHIPDGKRHLPNWMTFGKTVQQKTNCSFIK